MKVVSDCGDFLIAMDGTIINEPAYFSKRRLVQGVALNDWKYATSYKDETGQRIPSVAASV